MTSVLREKVALITGAGSGIGRAIARAFAAAGAHVALCGRTEAKLETTREGMDPASTLVLPFPHEDPAAVDAAMTQVIDHFGALDVLVNNAGTYIAERVGKTSLEDWQQSLAANLTGPFLMSRAALPHLRKRPGSSILNMASTLALQPIPGAAPYCVSKAGLVMLTRATALEEAPHGVRVNAICPGVVDTPIHRQRVGESSAALEQFLEQMGEAHPLGRVGKAEEVAASALFLTSDASGWTTGSVLCVDGGISLL